MTSKVSAASTVTAQVEALERRGKMPPSVTVTLDLFSLIPVLKTWAAIRISVPKTAQNNYERSVSAGLCRQQSCPEIPSREGQVCERSQ